MLDKERLLTWLKDNYAPMDTHFVYDIVENIIDYAIKYHTVLENQIEFIVQMIGDVTREEILQFIY